MWTFLLHAWNLMVQCIVYEIALAVIGVLIMMRGTLFLQPFWLVKEALTHPKAASKK